MAKLFRIIVGVLFVSAAVGQDTKPTGTLVREMFAPDLYDSGVPASDALADGAYPTKEGSTGNPELQDLLEKFPAATFYDNTYLVMEGDIVLATVLSNGEVKTNLGADILKLLSVGIATPGSTKGFWDTDPLVYEVATNNTSTIQNINSAIAHYEAKTAWRFKLRTDEKDYISFIDANGCYSSVGKVGGKQNIGVSQYCGVGSTVHEIGHAIGLWHEQSRMDRDEYITIYTDKIKSNRLNNFDKHSNSETYAPYDYRSIMHYSQWAFQKDSDSITIETKDPDFQNVIGQRDGLSDSDIISVQRRRRLIAGCTGDGSDYMGFAATTASGRSCQPWDSQSPHKHPHTPANYPISDLVNNYCRNPSGEARPWCYTTDPEKEWEICNVQCGDKDLRVNMGTNSGATHLNGDYVHAGSRNERDYYVRGGGCVSMYLVYNDGYWEFTDQLSGWADFPGDAADWINDGGPTNPTRIFKEDNAVPTYALDNCKALCVATAGCEAIEWRLLKECRLFDYKPGNYKYSDLWTVSKRGGSGGSYVQTLQTTIIKPTELSGYPHLWKDNVFVHIYSPEACGGNRQEYIGDGYCDTSYNNAECGWDGGDCCSASCQPSRGFTCGKSAFNCQDPYYKEAPPASDFTDNSVKAPIFSSFGSTPALDEPSKFGDFKATDSESKGTFGENKDGNGWTDLGFGKTVNSKQSDFPEAPPTGTFTWGGKRTAIAIGAAATTFGIGVVVFVLRRRRKYTKVVTRHICEV